MPARNPLTTQIIRVGRTMHPIGTQDGKWYTISDDFQLLPPVGAAAASNNASWTITGTGTVPTPVIAAPSTNGLAGFTLATRTASAADADQARIFGLTPSQWSRSVTPTALTSHELEFDIATPSAITEQAIFAGLKLTDTGVLATDNDQAYFLYDTTATSPAASTSQWVCVSSVGGTDTVTASGVTVAVSTNYNLRIVLRTDKKAYFYINDALVHTAATAFAGTEALKVSAGVISRTAAGAPHSVVFRKARLSTFTTT
jgi:hypothetical protein